MEVHLIIHTQTDHSEYYNHSCYWLFWFSAFLWSEIIYTQCLKASHSVLVPWTNKCAFSLHEKLSSIESGWQMCVGRLLQVMVQQQRIHDHWCASFCWYWRLHFIVKVAAKLILNSQCLCSWGPADCWHYRQWQWSSDAVSPGAGLRSVLGAAVELVVTEWARLEHFTAWQACQLARQQDGAVSPADHWGQTFGMSGIFVHFSTT